MVAGVRLASTINNNWDVIVRADIGGFGLSADFTSTVEAGVTYNISKLMTLDMKYKATWVDFENSDPTGTAGYFQYDTLTHGPILGLSFNF
jgi:opacity protein-like surface antigen